MSASSERGFAVYRRLVSSIKPFLWSFIFAVIANMLYGGVDAAFTYILKPVLDKGFVARDMAFIHWLPLLIIGLFIIRGSASFAASYFMTFVGRSLVMQFRQRVFNHLLVLPSRFFDQTSSGQLLSTIIYNIDQVASASTDALTTLVQASCMIIGLFIVMFLASWQLTLIYLAVLPLVALVVKVSSRQMRRLSHRIQDSVAEVTHIAEETIEGYRVVRTFGGADYERKKFAKATLTNRKRELQLVIVKALAGAVIPFFAAMALALTLYLAMSPQSSLAISAGSFVSLVAAMLALLKPMKNLTAVNGTIQKGLAAAQSIFTLIDKPTEHNSGQVRAQRVRGHIRFDQVCFHYPQQQHPVLNNIAIDIKAGQTIALVGRSGAGKSTLVSLLPRFYEVTRGNIFLDDVALAEYDLTNLRDQIAVVSQQVVLFNDTIRNNIAYGACSHASEAQIVAAAKQAHAAEFIATLADGMDTMVGENGVLLSGGQRQRLAIARALLKDAPILILDEATASLDTESEWLIQQALVTLMAKRTTLVIAHRLSTIEKADLILVMDQGQIVEQGTHQQLLSTDGYYAKLYHMQYAGNKEVLC